MNQPPEHLPFPRTNHFILMPGVAKPDFKRLHPEEQMHLILASPCVVEEKCDGSNLGISFDEDGEVFFQGRTKYLNFTKTHPQHHRLFNWFWPIRDALWEALGPNRIVFGEWMYARHTLKYEALPDWFLAFDIMERPAENEEPVCWRTDRRNELLERVGITPVPNVAQGPFKSVSDLLALTEIPSALGNEKREGLYIRLEDENGLVCRAKMVRPEFQKKHEEEDDWSRKFVRETNVLATK